jgi:hypothetical protein
MDTYQTSASNVCEGNEVRIGGRWGVCEESEHIHAADGSVELVTLWIEEIPYSFKGTDQLAVCS